MVLSDRRTDRRTDGQTDGRTGHNLENMGFCFARQQLLNYFKHIVLPFLSQTLLYKQI